MSVPGKRIGKTIALPCCDSAIEDDHVPDSATRFDARALREVERQMHSRGSKTVEMK